MSTESRVVHSVLPGTHSRIQLIGLHVGRAGLASLFILGGLNKVLNYSGTLTFMRDNGLPFAEFLLPLTILLELGGGLWVALGRQGYRSVALALAAFTLLVNVFFHPFWAIEEQPRATLELSLFFKNIAIACGLIGVASGLFDTSNATAEEASRS